MERLKTALYSQKNIDMIQTLCIKRIKNTVDADTFDWIKPRFTELFLTVMNTIFEEEIYNYADLPLKTSVIKINGIVMKEAFNYITNVRDEPVMSTPIEDIKEEGLIERTEYIEELKRENQEKYESLEPKPLVPEFIEELYEIGSKNMTKEGEEYISEIYIPNVKKLDLLQLRIDKSDYMITEYCNKFEIDSIIIEVEPGNYNEEELRQAIQILLDKHVNSKEDYLMKIIINFEKTNDRYSFVYKSIDSSTKETVKLNFNVNKSIACILGFDKKVYIIDRDEKLIGHKHNLSYPTLVLFDIDFTSEIKAQALAPLNVNYNETKFYDLEYKKSYQSKESPLFDISQIKIKLHNERGEPYNTREREFYIRFKTTCLSN